MTALTPAAQRVLDAAEPEHIRRARHMIDYLQKFAHATNCLPGENVFRWAEAQWHELCIYTQAAREETPK